MARSVIPRFARVTAGWRRRSRALHKGTPVHAHISPLDSGRGTAFRVSVVDADLVLGGLQRQAGLSDLPLDSFLLVDHEAATFRDGARTLFDELDVALEVVHGHAGQAHTSEEEQAAQVGCEVLAVPGGVASGPHESLLLVVPEGVRRQTDEPGGLGDTLGQRRGLDRGVVEQIMQRIDRRRGRSVVGSEDAFDQRFSGHGNGVRRSERAHRGRHVREVCRLARRRPSLYAVERTTVDAGEIANRLGTEREPERRVGGVEHVADHLGGVCRVALLYTVGRRHVRAHGTNGLVVDRALLRCVEHVGGVERGAEATGRR